MRLVPGQRLARIAAVAGVLLAVGCAHSPPSNPWDPIEPVNRAVFTFNRTADRYVAQPLARGYNKITPNPVKTSVGNFFANAHTPITIVNSALQLKLESFNVALGRFMINTTVGIGGLFDVASALNVGDPDEDLGQTLGYWGVGPGAFVMLPLLGPSDGRDAVGAVGDSFVYPVTYIDQIDGSVYDYLPYALRVLDLVNTRARLLGFENTLEQQFDPYAFVRGYYLENRIKSVYDGDVPPELMQQSFDTDDDAGGGGAIDGDGL